MPGPTYLRRPRFRHAWHVMQIKNQQTVQLKNTHPQAGITLDTYMPLRLEGITFFCGKKDCCRKYKKRGKKRCKKCPDVN